MHVFGRWEEAGVPGENPRIHGENMQTPHRKAPEPGTLLLWGDGANRHTTVQPQCNHVVCICYGMLVNKNPTIMEKIQ